MNIMHLDECVSFIQYLFLKYLIWQLAYIIVIDSLIISDITNVSNIMWTRGYFIAWLGQYRMIHN